MVQLSMSLFETPFGTGRVWGNSSGIVQVDLPATPVNAGKSQSYGIQKFESMYTRMASDQLTGYFAGGVKVFEIPVDLSGYSVFQQKVLEEARRIQFGKVLSYKQVALKLGNAKWARAVGGVMAANRIPIIIPCHRVVASSGHLTGFSAPGGINLKKYLLTMEEVDFMGDSTVSVI